MAANLRAHRASVQAALALNADLGRLFAQVGTKAHPRGQIITAYRGARRAMRDVLRRGGRQMEREAVEVLAGLRQQVGASATLLLANATEAGARNGQRQAEARGVRVVERPPVLLAPLATAWVAGVDVQIAGATAALQAGLDYEALLLGDAAAGQLGLLNPAPVARSGAQWLAVAALLGWQAELGGAPALVAGGWHKQAVAGLDERTTECCLRAHGQVVPFDADFVTTGSPAWAERQHWTPFHWWCRTAICLVGPDEADDPLTREMQAAAQAELRARQQTGTRATIHPAHSRSRR